MVYLKTTLEVRGRKSIFGKAGLTNVFRRVMVNTVDGTLQDMETEAKKIYLEKRKATGDSFVISSFLIENAKRIGKMEVSGVVFAGGSKAPWAKYLESDHKLRDGNMWSNVNPKAPYKFMEGAVIRGKETIAGHFRRELKAVGGV